MTSYSFRHSAKVLGAILLGVVSLSWSIESRGEERWPGDVRSHRLSDTKRPGAKKTEEPGRLQEPKVIAEAAFRLTDRGAEAAFPRVPGILLSKLADAAIPALPDELNGKTMEKPIHALPPIDVDPNTITPPADAIATLGGACAACETCGSRDRCVACDARSTCDTCGGSGLACDCRYRQNNDGWFQNTTVFLAGDAWKNIFDDDDNNNFGFRTGFNMGVGLPGDRGVRGQVGISYGAYDFHGRESLLSSDDPIEQQVFATAGLFKRSSIDSGDRIAWGAVYDVMASEDAGERADRLKLAQLRGYLGYALNERNEIGTWLAFRLMDDYAPRQRVKVNVTDQVNLFWHRNWKLGGDTTAYVGWADDPGDVVIGLNGRVPLNNHVALFGNVHYIIPSTTGGDVHPSIGTDDIFSQEAWNVTFGIMFYRGGKAISPTVSGISGLPLLPVADNGTFSYQADML